MGNAEGATGTYEYFMANTLLSRAASTQPLSVKPNMVGAVDVPQHNKICSGKKNRRGYKSRNKNNGTARPRQRRAYN